jgi:hypothetical protein
MGVDKESVELLIGSLVHVEHRTSKGLVPRTGELVKVTPTSLIIESLEGNRSIIELDAVQNIKEVRRK